MTGTFRHYRALARQLAEHVDAGTQAALLAGMDYVTDRSTPRVKVVWAREMMARMDALLDHQTRVRVREGCACVLSNERSIYARAFRKLRQLYPDEDVYLDEVVKYLNATSPLRRCGDVTRDENGVYSVIARGECACPVLHAGLREVVRDEGGLRDPISVTWCHCSKGSLLSVYRYVFPEKTCEMEIVETVATGGAECRFVTTWS